MNQHEVVVGLAALAHPLRLELCRALAAAGPRGLTPGVIEDALAVPAATLSFHLRRLSEAGLVTIDRSGRFLIYRAASERIRQVVDFLGDQCCGTVSPDAQPGASPAAAPRS